MNYNDANLEIYKEKYQACFEVANRIKNLNATKNINIAISGGSSPLLLFKIMRDEFNRDDFKNINFFWVDERYVDKDSEESNYGNFEKILINTNIINKDKVFPMYKKGERDELIFEIVDKIKKYIPYKNGYPNFDLIILGLGDDGHTASLFPDNLKEIENNNIIIKTTNPYNNQKRLTLTKNVINNSKELIFLVFGKSKAIKVKEVLKYNDKRFPASYIKKGENVFWYLDKYSASLIP